MLAMTATPEPLREPSAKVLPLPLKSGNSAQEIVLDAPAPSVASVYSPREDLFLEGDEASYLMEVVEGVVCAYRLLPDGHRHVVSFYFPGDLIGYCCSGSHTFTEGNVAGMQGDNR